MPPGRHAVGRTSFTGSLLALLIAGVYPRTGHAGEVFRFATTRILVDDLPVDAPALESPLLTLSAFDFGDWSAADAVVEDGALVLRHRRLSTLRLRIDILGPDRTVPDSRRWRAYVARRLDQLGPDADAVTIADTTANPQAVQKLGWATFEGDFTLYDAIGNALAVERHVVASSDSLGVSFVLTGSLVQVRVASEELHRFTALLVRRPHDAPEGSHAHR
jgi:hypothetical protein